MAHWIFSPESTTCPKTEWVPSSRGSARIRELQGTIAQATIEASIREVSARVAAQQDRGSGGSASSMSARRTPTTLVAPGGSTGQLVREMRDHLAS